ncbi:hypothetical protein JCM8547_006914 [Rhodosporidiobolus lusitaniae]
MASPAASTSPSAPPSGPPKLVNLYNVRTVGSSKSCFICHRETTVCLATDGVTDFLYVCRSHLLDPGFARPAPSSAPATPPPSSPAPSPVPQSEVDKVKKEYEDKQARKAAAASSDSSDSKPDVPSKSPASTAFGLLKTGASTLSSLSTSAATTLFPPPPPVLPSASEKMRAEAEKAKVFVLQRDFFAMRVAAKRREWEKKDAKERGGAWSFPKAPTGKIG